MCTGGQSKDSQEIVLEIKGVELQQDPKSISKYVFATFKQTPHAYKQDSWLTLLASYPDPI